MIIWRRTWWTGVASRTWFGFWDSIPSRKDANKTALDSYIQKRSPIDCSLPDLGLMINGKLHPNGGGK